MPDDKEKGQSLVPHDEQRLSVPASIIKRGLQDVIQHRIPAVAWSRPSLVGTLSNPSESVNSDGPARKDIFFVCHLRNITESPKNFSEGVGVHRRSRTTGEITELPRDGFGFPASRIFIPAKEVSPPIQLGLSFQREKPLKECLKELFQESCELLAYDEKFHTVIVIPLDQPGIFGLPASTLKQKRILEVDDEEPVRDIIRGMLVSAGYDCTSVPNGVDALTLLESGEKFDLLIHDLLNAPMDGIQLLVKAQEDFSDLPIIVASAVNDISVALAVLKNGASDYIVLPFEREQLLAIVRQVLAGHKNRILFAWEQNLSTLIAPAVEGQLVVRTADGEPKHIWDLSPGDIVSVKREDGVKMLHLVERDGKLGAIESVPITRE